MECIKAFVPLNGISRNYIFRLAKLSHPRNYFIRSSSTHHNVDTQELTMREKIQLSKPSVTKWRRPPFMKNFFFGKFDVELLAFPEILNKEQLADLENVVKSVNSVFTERVNSMQIEQTKEIPGDVLQDFKEWGLFGRKISSQYGGLDITYTECTRLNEVLGLDWSIYSTIATHEFFATKAVLTYGSEQQKKKYLPDMASGKCIAALCCKEKESGCDLMSMETRAQANSDGSSFVLSGSKTWVTNAELADVYIVFAKTVNPVDFKNEDISAFIVDRDTEGISVEHFESQSLHGMNMGKVTFKEASVPSSNLIGKLGEGFPMFFNALESFRIAMSSFTFGTLKLLLDSITERIIHTERVERSLGDVQLIRERLSKINTTIYAMESAAYYTAAILDSTLNPDIGLESAAIKVFNSEGTLYCLRELMNLVGTSSLLKEFQLERFYRDAQALAVFDWSNDLARLYIGLTGIKSVGAKRSEDVVKMRNPFFFPKDTFKNIIKRQRVLRNKIKYDQDLAGYMHPSLVAEGNHLEESLQKFHIAVLHVLELHGIKVVHTQLDPVKLADVAIDLYVMSAVIARSSRSYCLGLKNAHHELRIAETFCFDAHHRVTKTLDKIFKGVTYNNDGNNLILGEQVIDCRGYFAEHPLKHNY